MMVRGAETRLGFSLTTMDSVVPQVESETTTISDNLQNPVLPPSDVEVVVKAEIKESFTPILRLNATLT